MGLFWKQVSSSQVVGVFLLVIAVLMVFKAESLLSLLVSLEGVICVFMAGVFSGWFGLVCESGVVVLFILCGVVVVSLVMGVYVSGVRGGGVSSMGVSSLSGW